MRKSGENGKSKKCFLVSTKIPYASDDRMFEGTVKIVTFDYLSFLLLLFINLNVQNKSLGKFERVFGGK